MNDIPEQFLNIPERYRKLAETYVDTGKKSIAASAVGYTRQHAGRLLNNDPALIEYQAWLKQNTADVPRLSRNELGDRLLKTLDLAEAAGDLRTASAILGRLAVLYGYDAPKQLEQTVNDQRTKAPEVPESMATMTPEQLQKWYEQQFAGGH